MATAPDSSRSTLIDTGLVMPGYESTVVPFIRTMTDGITAAAQDAGIDLLVLNNKASRKTAMRAAAHFIREKVDLVIECPDSRGHRGHALSEQYANARIPVIAVDAPQPGAVYFGADNYKARLYRWNSSRPVGGDELARADR